MSQFGVGSLATAATFIPPELKTRKDVLQTANQLVNPLLLNFSPGKARVQSYNAGASFDSVATALEGFARILWAVAPIETGSDPLTDTTPPSLQTLSLGIVNGTNPNHEEYWGDLENKDQRMVEMAAIAFAILINPDEFWPIDKTVQDQVTAWLLQINNRDIPDNNWLFFRVLVNLALGSRGARFDESLMLVSLSRLEEFYLGDGWYSDGFGGQRDYYISFAFHFYSLVYCKYAVDDDARIARFKSRAATFADDFVFYFNEKGSAIPFGRSLTYRFAHGAFWAAMAFAGVTGAKTRNGNPVLSMSAIKHLVLQNLRFWSQQHILNGDGTLCIGYCYNQQLLAEEYNSPLSPYWSLKSFLILALPSTDTFWTTEEAAPNLVLDNLYLAYARMIIHRNPSGHVYSLTGGQWPNFNLRHRTSKYNKFSYSASFGFSIPSGVDGLEQHAGDNTLLLSNNEDRNSYRDPMQPEVVGGLQSFEGRASICLRWKPWRDVEVTTWLISPPTADSPWHQRIHKITSKRHLWSAEGAFAVSRENPHGRFLSDFCVSDKENLVAGALGTDQGIGFAVTKSTTGISGIRGNTAFFERFGSNIKAFPNTNVMFPRTLIPTLLGEVNPGESWIKTSIFAIPITKATASPNDLWLREWNKPPSFPVLH
jgi:hypothetical protein